MQMLEFLSTVLTFRSKLLESKQIHVISMVYQRNRGAADYWASGARSVRCLNVMYSSTCIETALVTQIREQMR